MGSLTTAFVSAFDDPMTAQAVAADRHHARRRQVQSVPTLIVRETGAHLVDGARDDLAPKLRAARRLVV